MSIQLVGPKVNQGHLHMVIPPNYAVSRVVEALNGHTSRALWENFAFLATIYWDGDGSWSPGDCASTVGVDEAIIRRCVEMQGQEDAGQAQLEWC